MGKGRPKFVRRGNYVGTYTPERTANYETLVKWYYTQASKGCTLTGQIKADITAYCPIPKSTSLKQHQAMLDGKIRPTKKPDWDNIGKIICDALNGIAYKDDSAIVCGTVDKFYSENPRVEVTLVTQGKIVRNGGHK
jgi:Holliday junction resolvase RusA-like endonuclease